MLDVAIPCDQPAYDDALSLGFSLSLPKRPCESACEWFIGELNPLQEPLPASAHRYSLNVDETLNGGFFGTYPINCTKWLVYEPTLQLYFTNYTYMGYDVPCLAQPQNVNSSTWTAYYCQGYLKQRSGQLSCEAQSARASDHPRPVRNADVGRVLARLHRHPHQPPLFGLLLRSFAKDLQHVQVAGVLMTVGALISMYGGVSFMLTAVFGMDDTWADGGTTFLLSPTVAATGFDQDGVRFAIYYTSTSEFTTRSALCSFQGFGIYTVTAALMILLLMVPIVMLPDIILGMRLLAFNAWLSKRVNFTLFGYKYELNYSNQLRTFGCSPCWSRGPSAWDWPSTGTLSWRRVNGYCGFDPQDLDYIVPFWNVFLVCFPIASLLVSMVLFGIIVRHVATWWGSSTNRLRNATSIFRGLWMVLVACGVVFIASFSPP